MDNGFLQREDFHNRLTAAREQTQERERHVGSPALGTKSGGKEVRLHVMHGHNWADAFCCCTVVDVLVGTVLGLATLGELGGLLGGETGGESI